jgi:phosphatidylglycerophosphate synthase
MQASTVSHAQNSQFHHATRVHQALTASAEKRILHWLAVRTPLWITSDQLTVLGLVAQCVAGLCYAVAATHPLALVGASLSIALNWLGDSLDGTLARTRHQERPRYGFYVDHVVDIVGSVAMMAGLACSGLVHPQVATAMLVAFLVLAAESYLATYTLGRFEMAHSYFGPTEIRILLIAGNLELLRTPFAPILGHKFLLFDIGGITATTAMALMALGTASRHTRQLFLAEPLVQNRTPER